MSVAEPTPAFARATYFARAGRASEQDLARQVGEALAAPVVQVVLDAVDGYALILNSQRQILAANGEIIDALARTEPSCLVGLRPGEAMNCLHFTEGPDGCGTSVHCRSCGAVIAILTSQQDGAPATRECRLSVLRNGEMAAVDMRVRATPLEVAGHRLTAVVLHDISAEKRREVLERTFFHDALNAIGGIEGWSARLDGSDEQTAAREILALVEGLKEEIVTQQMLMAAESGALSTQPVETSAADVLARLGAVFERHPVRAGRNLDLAPAPEAPLTTDRTLLLRVLINMVKNALEAIRAGETVRVWYETRNGAPVFVVENPGEIPDSVRPHVFERSFSTKAEPGRGVGTYSMKLYGERFLGGKVEFTSDPKRGVAFSIALPAESAGAPRPCEEAASPAAGRRVLLVDDQEPVLRLAELFLRELGYSPLPFTNPIEAWDAVRAAPDSFDIVVADLSMPQIGGLELARRVATLRPDAPFFLCTGFGESQAPAGAPPSVRGVIHKPFTIAALSEALARPVSRTANP